MIIEGLVIFSCLNASGCTETTSTYYDQNPEIRKNLERIGEDLQRNEIVKTMMPFAGIVNGEYRINSEMVIKYKNEQIYFIMELK